MIAERKPMGKKKSEIIPQSDSGRGGSDTGSIRIKSDLIQMIRVILTEKGGTAADLVDQMLRPQLTVDYFHAMERLRAAEEEIKRNTGKK